MKTQQPEDSIDKLATPTIGTQSITSDISRKNEFIGKEEVIRRDEAGVVTTVMNKFGPGSLKATVFTLLSATLGVGMLAIPQAFQKSGIVLSAILLYVAAFFSFLSIMCLVWASDSTKLTTYSDLATWSYGPKFKYFVDMIFFTNVFGTAVAYSIATKENIAFTLSSLQAHYFPNMPHILYDQSAIIWIVIPQSLLLFLVLRKYLTELRVFSLLSFGIIIYILLLIIGNCFAPTYTKDIDQKFEELRYFRPGGLSASLPMFIFGFTCQQNVLTCCRELNNTSVRRMSKTVSRHIFISSSMYLLVGVFGYLTFMNEFSEKDENILTKYDSENIPVVAVASAKTREPFC